MDFSHPQTQTDRPRPQEGQWLSSPLRVLPWSTWRVVSLESSSGTTTNLGRLRRRHPGPPPTLLPPPPTLLEAREAPLVRGLGGTGWQVKRAWGRGWVT